jgi:hypothetical protein
MREYTVSAENQAITNAGGDQDLFSVQPATQKPVQLYGISIIPTTEVGEAQEEVLRFSVIRGHTTVGSGGAAATPRPLNPSDAAAACSCRIGDTTIASGGTAIGMHPFGIPVRVGDAFFYPAGSEIRVVNAEFLVVRLMAAPTDDLNANVCFWIIEE